MQNADQECAGTRQIFQNFSILSIEVKAGQESLFTVAQSFLGTGVMINFFHKAGAVCLKTVGIWDTSRHQPAGGISVEATYCHAYERSFVNQTSSKSQSAL